MEHEEFVRRAALTARNAQGIRSLARQVRLLYDEIRALQFDDNAYLYIAEVIAAARGDKLDVALIADRIRVYHYRDRKQRGDKPIGRGSKRMVDPDPSERSGTGTGQFTPAPTGPHHGARGSQALRADVTSPAAGQPLAPAPDQAPAGAAGAAVRSPPAPAELDTAPRRALTHALHHRSGRRQVIDAG